MVLTVAVLGLLGALAGCGAGGSSSSVATRTSARAPAPAGHRKPPPPAGQTAQKPHKPVAPCGSDDLVVTHSELGDGALSHYYTTFTLRNTSTHACSISGFPKIVALEADGRPIGAPAKHGTPSPEIKPGKVTIGKNRAASFRASWEEDVYSAGKCGPRTVTHFRVFLPGSHLAQTVPYPVFGRCSSPIADASFSVSRIELPSDRSFPRTEPYVRAALPSEGLPRCRGAGLLVWDGPDHFAGIGLGSSYSRIDVMNLTDHACEIAGQPRLVAVDLHGRQVGFPAKNVGTFNTRGHVRIARIGPRRSGVIEYATGGYYNYGDHGCEHRYAAGFRVTLPGISRAQYLPAPIQRCLRIRKQLSVGPIE